MFYIFWWQKNKGSDECEGDIKNIYSFSMYKKMACSRATSTNLALVIFWPNFGSGMKTRTISRNHHLHLKAPDWLSICEVYAWVWHQSKYFYKYEKWKIQWNHSISNISLSRTKFLVRSAIFSLYLELWVVKGSI